MLHPSPGSMILRPLKREDLPLLHRWYQDPDVNQRLVGDIRQRPEAEAVTYMERWLAPNSTEVRFGIVAGNGQLVGVVSLQRIDHAAGRAETHSLIGSSLHRGRGYGRVALTLLLTHAFRVLHLRQITALILADNGASLALHARLGFQREGVRVMLKAGRPVEVVVIALTADCFRDLRHA